MTAGIGRRRVPLDRERILRAGIELADRDGIDALTMRRLAQALGVEAMTLYYHVANKDALLDGMIDLVEAEIAIPSEPPGRDWKAALRATAMSAYAVFLRHPWAAPMISTTTAGPARKRYMDALLGGFRSGGFSAVMTHHAYHALESHIVGFTLWAVGIETAMAVRPDTVTAFLATLDPDVHPHLAEHVQQHMDDVDPDGPSEFEFGLDLLLDGLERRRRAR